MHLAVHLQCSKEVGMLSQLLLQSQQSAVTFHSILALLLTCCSTGIVGQGHVIEKLELEQQPPKCLPQVM